MLYLPHLLIDVLIRRGIEDIDAWLARPSVDQVTSSLELKDVEAAVDRILAAIRRREPMLLYGDYDCDGVLGTAILLETIKALGGVVDAYLPHRDEGYGFGCPSAFRAARAGYHLVVTIDNGVGSGKALHLAARLGTEVIVIDHHQVPEKIPARLVWSEALCGAGLAWLLSSELLRRARFSNRENFLLELAPFAAVAGIADCVPLTGQQRALVRLGIDQMPRTRCATLRELLALAGVPKGKQPSARDIGFGVAPRINAAGRMAHPKLALEALLCSSEQEAGQQALVLDDLNRRRRELEREILPHLLQQTASAAGGMVFFGEEWPRGIAGILAARAAEHFRRPAIVLVRDRANGQLTGSGRSLPGVDLHAVLTQCAPMLERFGGHAQAVGLTLRETSLDAFREAFTKTTANCDSNHEDSPGEEGVLNLSALSARFWEACQALEPFGMGFSPFRFRVAAAVFEYRRRGGARLGQGGRWLRVTTPAVCPQDGVSGDFLVEVDGRGATLLSHLQ